MTEWLDAFDRGQLFFHKKTKVYNKNIYQIALVRGQNGSSQLSLSAN